jgi:hypothetical protein
MLAALGVFEFSSATGSQLRSASSFAAKYRRQ